MSARKSWESRPKSADGKGKASLRERRRKARRIFFTLLSLIIVLSFGGAVYAVWQEPVRIKDVSVTGEHAEGMRELALAELAGTYAFVIPRNSIFFYPEQRMREAILAAYPHVAAVSVSRTSFDAITLNPIPRIPAFIWCGPSLMEANQDGRCYETDAEGLVFAETAPDTLASSTAIRIYAPLDASIDASSTPLRAHVHDAHRVPDALRFVKAMQSLKVPIRSIELRGDEADLYVPGGTRITYVLGKEEEAAALAAAAFPTLTLTDGSIDYVDLRFGKRVYLKRVGE